MFGEATYRFSPQWALTGGLRYYDFDEDRTLTFAGLFADPGSISMQPGSMSSDGVSPRVILAFSPNDDVQFTAQVARGFRLGGINDPLNVDLCSPADLVTYDGHENWEDEDVTNYEIGAKTRSSDGRVTFNAAVFLSDIDGLQVIADAGTCSSRIILNAQAESIGAEMELFVRPNEHWDLGSVGHLRAGGDHRVAARRHGTDRRHSRWQSSADVARAAGRGQRGLQLRDDGRPRELRATSRCSTSDRRTRSSPTRSRTSA